jgi:membrane protein
VQAVLSRGRPDVVSIGFVLALWSGSTAMSDFVNTITIAYDLRDCRSAVRSRLLALGLYLGFVACGIVILPAVALGPKLIVQLAPDTYRHTVSTLVSTVYWPVVVIGSLGLLATLYHLAVPVRTTWRRALPGAVLAFGLWLLGSYLLRLYLSLVFGAESTYGSLSAPIAVLLFFYVTALAVLVGAELNAEIDKLWPSVATAQARADKKAPGRDRSSNPTSSRRAKHWRADSADGEASRTDGRR